MYLAKYDYMRFPTFYVIWSSGCDATLKIGKHYLNSGTFQIFTDHRNLKYLMGQKESSMR